MSQNSRTPYDHLRYRYPETWKKLIKMIDENGAPVAVGTDGPAPRTSSGFRLEGSHTGPMLMQTSPSLSKCQSDPAINRWRNKEKESVHTLRLQVNTHRNPFGGWYEGSKMVEKVGSATFAA
mmetsp:Transcript_40716/g.131164  ORF Transcript_40716/g.131164 Transcript_40716/m.131164 type:complete len:122 (-) Transcript_40716:102-467(-)